MYICVHIYTHTPSLTQVYICRSCNVGCVCVWVYFYICIHICVYVCGCSCCCSCDWKDDVAVAVAAAAAAGRLNTTPWSGMRYMCHEHTSTCSASHPPPATPRSALPHSMDHSPVVVSMSSSSLCDCRSTACPCLDPRNDATHLHSMWTWEHGMS